MPFVYGGAERHVRNLVRELRRHGYRAKKVSIPFKSYPKGELLAQAALWRLVDLSESNYETIDAVIATKFPTYFVRHPNKVTWLFHQYRAIYDLCGTPFSEFTDTEADVRLRDQLIGLDTEVLAESTRLFSNARNTAARLAKYNGLTAEPLYHPPPLAGALERRSVRRLRAVGGTARAQQARRSDHPRAGADRPASGWSSPARALIGRGSRIWRSKLGVADRVTFTGDIDDRQLVDLYANALAVVFPPLDEDYGYVTLEAFLAHKPVRHDDRRRRPARVRRRSASTA